MKKIDYALNNLPDCWSDMNKKRDYKKSLSY
jgi:hypothetical protein